jgi:hypothetical protein
MKLNALNTQQQNATLGQAQTATENDLLALLANGNVAGENQDAFLNELKNQLSSEDEAFLLNELNNLNTNTDALLENLGSGEIKNASKQNLISINNDSVQTLLGDLDAEQVEALLQGDAQTLNVKKLETIKTTPGQNSINRSPAVLDGMQSVEDLKSTDGAIDTGILQTQSTEDFLQNRAALKNSPNFSHNHKMTQHFLKNSDPNQMIKMMSKSETAQMNMLDGKVDVKMSGKINSEELVNNVKTQEVSEMNFANNGETIKDATRLDNLNLGELKTQSVENNASGKVFKLEQLASTELSDTDKLISKISDYIIQSKASSEPRVEMSIAHKEFGVMDIVVEKMSRSSDELNIIIRGQSELGRSVLGQNQSELMSTLAKSGVQVADFKIESSSSNSTGQFTQSEQGQSKQDGSAANRQFGSEQNQRNHDSQKRKELWDVLYSREAA